jgi:hypothetical protein
MVNSIDMTVTMFDDGPPGARLSDVSIMINKMYEMRNKTVDGPI